MLVDLSRPEFFGSANAQLHASHFQNNFMLPVALMTKNNIIRAKFWNWHILTQNIGYNNFIETFLKIFNVLIVTVSQADIYRQRVKRLQKNPVFFHAINQIIII